MEYYLAITRSKILVHDSIKMEYENILLTERIYAQNVNILLFFYISGIDKSINTESSFEITKEWVEGEMTDYLMSTGCFSGVMEF